VEHAFGFKKLTIKENHMRDLIQQFQKQSRRKADAELIARWEFHMRYRGDQDIKSQATQAKRIATQLVKACETFSNLAPEQELAFKAAASGMRKLAADLTALALWAKDYSVFNQKEQERIKNQNYAAKAQERWGDDTSKFEFECKMVRELRTDEGKASFIEWLRAQPAFSEHQSSRIILPFNNFPSNPDQMNRLDVIRFLVESHTQRRSFSNGYAHASTEDYENYLKFRQEVERYAAISIQQARTKEVKSK
jgi:hypothetical protein